MEDFDYIDALAKSELSNRTATPSADGWNTVQQKMKRRKRRRMFVYIFLIMLFGIVGVYMTAKTNVYTDEVRGVEGNTEQLKSTQNNNKQIIKETTSDSILTIIQHSNSKAIVDDASQTNMNSLNEVTANTTKNQLPTTNVLHKAGKSTSKPTSNHSRFLITKNKIKHDDESIAGKEKVKNHQQEQLISNKEENFMLESAAVKLYDWELIKPTSLEKKKKKKKQRKTKKKDKLYENLDLMIGINGFIEPDDYKLLRSYVAEVSYTAEKKLKNKYAFNYGAGLQFRNLRFKNDTLSFNKGELSFNLFSTLEKRFGDFSIEAGAYAGYEIYSPNNQIFNEANIDFFDRKINYGVMSVLNYKKIGLVFKYELSPYINYLGNKKFGAFTFGVKYDF